MHVPFTGLAMKQVPPQGDTIHGHFVPGGTRIGHSFVGVERSRAVFGADVDIFRPERWLGVTTEKRREMAQVVELVFGHGRWGCAGKPVALMELNKFYIEVSERCLRCSSCGAWASRLTLYIIDASIL